MYLREVHLRNVKCFENVDLDFSEKGAGRDEVRRWTALLGENGLGKSTLLQAMAIPLAGPGAARELMPVAEGWVRQGKEYGEIESQLVWHEGDAQLPHWPKKTPYRARFIVSNGNPDSLPSTVVDPPTVPAVVEWTGGGSPRDREAAGKEMSRLKRTAYAEGKEGWLACGYGPFRRLSGGSQDADKILYSGRRAARFVTLFREDAALSSATEWLIELYNTARDGDVASERSLALVKEIFEKDFLLERAVLKVDARQALLGLQGRDPVPFRALSDGYRSMLALGIDLLRWIVQAFPQTQQPLSCRGVVLIDELDAHLHPRWQREIGNWLLSKFTGLQFVIATHSPFLAQVSGKEGNILLRQTEKGVQQTSAPGSVQAWRADQILAELFGLRSTYAPKMERTIDRFLTLERSKRDGKLRDADEREYSQLRIDFAGMPPGVEDSEDRAVLQTLDAAIRKQANRLGELK